MDTLAKEMGVSKKTIYQFYTNKDAIVFDCVSYLISELKKNLDPILSEKQSPVIKIVRIYSHCLSSILQFQNAFFYDLKKLHPEANQILDNFRQDYIFNNIIKLLKEAQSDNLILPGINIHLVCEIHFFRIVEVVDNFSLRSTMKFDDILKTLIISNLRGILKTSGLHLLDEFGLGDED